MKKEPKKKKDLATRERVNVVLATERIAALRAYSQETKVPVSRLLDEAIDLLREKRGF